MILHITAGEMMNEALKKPREQWVPFNEAMLKGGYTATPFSDEFIAERAKVHEVSVDEYKIKLSLFLDALKDLDLYEEIQLFFGDEPFCRENVKVVLKTLSFHKYKGKVTLHTVDERNCVVLGTTVIQLQKGLPFEAGDT